MLLHESKSPAAEDCYSDSSQVLCSISIVSGATLVSMSGDNTGMVVLKMLDVIRGIWVVTILDPASIACDTSICEAVRGCIHVY
jgi:hypothetical protein